VVDTSGPVDTGKLAAALRRPFGSVRDAFGAEASGPDSCRGGEGEEGVEGGLEGTGVALDLREEESALKRREKRHGEVVRVDAGREMPGDLESS
jgi:hypothetical protein